MLPFNLELPVRHEESPWTPWFDEIEEIYHSLFYHQQWKDDEVWAKEYDILAKKARYAYVIDGLVIAANKYYKIYKDKGYKTFEEYCTREVEKSEWQCNQAARAAQVSWHLICKGFEKIPSCVAQAARLLESAVKKDKKHPDVAGAWKKCLDAVHCTGKSITSNLIEAVVLETPEDKSKQLKIPLPVYKGLEKKAKRLGKTVTEYLEELAKEEEPEPQVEPTPEQDNHTEPESQTNCNTQTNDTRATKAVSPFETERRTRSSYEVCEPSRDPRLCEPFIPY
ncbi:MAG: hypothetical protein AB4038_03340 [Prochloraceae cyanobacterium]